MARRARGAAGVRGARTRTLGVAAGRHDRRGRRRRDVDRDRRSGRWPAAWTWGALGTRSGRAGLGGRGAVRRTPRRPMTWRRCAPPRRAAFVVHGMQPADQRHRGRRQRRPRCPRSSAQCSTPCRWSARSRVARLRARGDRPAARSRPGAGTSCFPRAYWCSARPPSNWAGPLRIGRGGLREGVISSSSRPGGGNGPWPRPTTSTVTPDEPYRRGRRADRARGARVSCSSTRRVCSTRATSSACTTCGWPRRRLRAVLEIFAPCFRNKRVPGGVLRDVKRLADALGERRDPDVHIDALRGVLEGASRRPTSTASHA